MNEKTYRDKKYLAFVRELDCCACGAHGPSDPHHAISGGGVGLKPSDAVTIPLCRMCHSEFHQMGILSFQKKHGISIAAEIATCLHQYLTGQRLRWPMSLVRHWL